MHSFGGTPTSSIAIRAERVIIAEFTARVVATFSATFNVILIAIFILIAITKRARDFENDRSAKTRSAIVNVECGAKFSDFHTAHAL
jgi:hypothetical protein